MNLGGAGLRELMRRFAGEGRLEAIWLRPERGVPMREGLEILAVAGRGLEGDRAARSTAQGGKRQVTLIQAEHLPVIAALSSHAEVRAEQLRVRAGAAV